MLLIGLTGGIGSGKSTVAGRFAELGAVVVDADRIAREVVEPGTPGLAEIVDRFGSEVLDADGALDRPAMAAKVFGDDDARAALNAITHPRIAERSAERFAAAPGDAIVVHDMPLLVELDMTPNYHLTVIVDAPEDVRVRRLSGRGVEESDARARIRAQATEEQRRAVADVWLDNSGTREQLLDSVETVWWRRLVPFEENVRLRRGAGRPAEGDTGSESMVRRVRARLERLTGEHAGVVESAGFGADDPIDFRVAVSAEDVEQVGEALAAGGFPRSGFDDQDRVHVPADPCLPVTVRLSASR
ncbi:dephospho-CoA kinase [Allosaccharopolyspora coralli]|uniref:Dephospho-CoA kinase n=1 Tax=Allosaccharopolyspora coralli TaxID=2665642 RepID=A0A5Q3Q9W1_9PSEU|nr:dephospho-CoA kinase [Allosaccharopolyspora coralli]QGK70650.1 dephospho-CoA kinase [Allosaccharopolyspora coralli]